MVFFEHKTSLYVPWLCIWERWMQCSSSVQSLQSLDFLFLIFFFKHIAEGSLIHLHVTCVHVYTIETGNGKALFQHAIRINSILGLYGGNCWLLGFDALIIYSHESVQVHRDFSGLKLQMEAFSAECVVMIMMRSFVVPHKFLR